MQQRYERVCEEPLCSVEDRDYAGIFVSES